MLEATPASGRVELPPYVPEEHLLRPRLGGAVVLLVVGLVGTAAYDGGDAIMLFWVLYALLPTVVAALLSLASWANRRHPQQVLLTILILALAVGPAIAVQRFAQSSGNALLLLVGAVVFVISVWLPQATVALLYFQLRRPGGITLSPRFSLRTFMILVTVVAIVLAGARYYEQSKEIVGVAEEFELSELNRWPASRAARADPETESLRREASKSIATHLATHLLQEGYALEPIPDRMERWLPRPLLDSSAEDQIVYDHSYHYFVQQTASSEKVYVLMARHDGQLAYLRTGIWCKQPSGGNLTNALDPTLLAEQAQVVNYFQRLETLAKQCDDLEELNERLNKLTNQQPATP